MSCPQSWLSSYADMVIMIIICYSERGYYCKSVSAITCHWFACECVLTSEWFIDWLMESVVYYNDTTAHKSWRTEHGNNACFIKMANYHNNVDDEFVSGPLYISVYERLADTHWNNSYNTRCWLYYSTNDCTTVQSISRIVTVISIISLLITEHCGLRLFISNCVLVEWQSTAESTALNLYTRNYQ